MKEQNKPVHLRGTQLIEELELNEELKEMAVNYYGDFYNQLIDFLVDLEKGEV